MEIVTNKEIFGNLFNDYRKAFSDYEELKERTRIPEDILKTDIRIRLALSLKIEFDSSISYTRTQPTRIFFTLIFKLVEIWFAYEGIYSMCEKEALVKSDRTKSDPFSIIMISELGLDEIMNKYIRYQNKNIYKVVKTLPDFIKYLNHLKEQSTGKTQINLIDKYINNAKGKKKPEFNQILSLIYAIRNMYVHKIETPLTGVENYSTKIEVIKNCNDFLTLVNLKIATFILKKRIEAIN